MIIFIEPSELYTDKQDKLRKVLTLELFYSNLKSFFIVRKY